VLAAEALIGMCHGSPEWAERA